MVTSRIFPLMLAAMLAGCSTDSQLGGSSGIATTGAAAGSSAYGASNQLEHCPAALGTLAINEDESAPWYAARTQYQLPSTVPLLRLVVQQSGCFVIVDRGRALNTALGERALRESGELRSGSRMGKGQVVAADYTMSPTINFSQQGTSGYVAPLNIIPFARGVLGGLAANARSNEASTVLLLVDNRSTVQIAAAQGSAKNWDLGGVGNLIGISSGFAGAGQVSGYANTPEGKLLAAAFLDSFNQMVRGLRSYQAQTVSGGLGTGGQLGVSGGSTPASRGE